MLNVFVFIRDQNAHALALSTLTAVSIPQVIWEASVVSGQTKIQVHVAHTLDLVWKRKDQAEYIKGAHRKSN
jgi:hypothetical protein